MEKLNEQQVKAFKAYDNLLNVNTKVGRYFSALGSKRLMETVAKSIGHSVEETVDLITSAIEKNPSEAASYSACRACKEPEF
jgi:hypothetical protein